MKPDFILQYYYYPEQVISVLVLVRFNVLRNSPVDNMASSGVTVKQFIKLLLFQALKR